MIDGRLLVDAHVHVARLPTLSADWHGWAAAFGSGTPMDELYDADGTPVPAAIDEHFAGQGADHVLLFAEYSPKATGLQPIEDVLPIVAANPARFRPVANINPHLHYPVAAEVERQVGLGAVALKIHPVHGGFEARDRMLYPAYAWAERHDLPVIGPNCDGMVRLHERAALWGDALRPQEPGGVALVSQSGNLAVNALATRRGLRLHTVVSCGNQAVLDAGDLLAFLAEDEGVRSVALYVEHDA